MKIEDLMNRWEAMPSADPSFQRIDDMHILDIFIGKDSDLRRELMVVSDIEPAKITSSKILDIQKGIRKDKRWATRIKLLNNAESEVFTHLCWDLIEHSRKASSKSLALEILIARFLKWQKLMENGSDLLSESVIRGMIGEIIYARKIIHSNLGWDEVLSAWLGPDGSDRDFVFNDTWVEVKTIKPGKNSVTISSLEQLDSEKPGTLGVVILDNTSSSDIEGFSFADIIDDMRDELRAYPNAMFHFEAKLMELGYSEHREYHEKHYVLRKIRAYAVQDEFPKIKRSDLPGAIVQASYEISLGEISSFETEV